MYLYCGNNPVIRIDDEGYFWDSLRDALLIVAGAALVVAAVAAVVVAAPVVATAVGVGVGISTTTIAAVGSGSLLAAEALTAGAILVETTQAVIGYVEASEHTKRSGSKKRTNDKHTKKRPGSLKDKAKSKPDWEYRGGRRRGPNDFMN